VKIKKRGRGKRPGLAVAPGKRGKKRRRTGGLCVGRLCHRGGRRKGWGAGAGLHCPLKAGFRGKKERKKSGRSLHPSLPLPSPRKTLEKVAFFFIHTFLPSFHPKKEEGGGRKILDAGSGLISERGREGKRGKGGMPP